MLASSLLGTESLMNTTVADNQRFATSGDRTMDVTGAGTVITAWATTDAQGSRIVAQRTWANGASLGGEFAVSEVGRGQRGNAVVAAAQDGRFVVAWVGRGNPQDPSGTGVFARTFSPDGTPLTGEFRVNATVRGNQQAPSIDWVSADRFVVAWDGAGKGQARSINARVFDVSGRAVTGAVRVPGTRRGAQRDAAVVSLPDGGFQVVWGGVGKGDANGIFSRQFDSAGKPLGPEFRVNTSRRAIESQPTIARDGNRQVVIAWQSRGAALDPNRFGVVARRFAPGGSPLGGEFLLNQTQRGSQSDPSIAFLADGRFVAVWEGAGPADSNGVYLREFFGNGTPRGGEELVNTTVAGRQADPTVQPTRRGYVVAWGGRVDGGLGVESRAEGTGGGDTNGIAIQRFGDALIAMPGNTPGLTSPSDVLWYDASATDPKYMKTITITNNSPDQTIYPFLEDANSRSPLPGDPAPSPTYAGTGVFDPFDPIIHEYRGYIGYRSEDGQDYLGLLPGQAITINVPLAFWDAGRLIISTDGVVSPGGSDLLGPDPNASPADQAAQPNPFYFHYVDNQEILIGSTTAGSATLNFTPIYDQNILGPNGKPAVNPNRPLRPTSVVPGMLVTGPGIASGNPILSVTSSTVELMHPVAAVDPNDPTKQEDTDYTFQLPNGVSGGNSALVTPDGTHLQPNQIQLNHALDPEKALLYYLSYGVTQGQTYAITSSGTDLQAGTVVTGADVATGVVTLSKETVSGGRGPNIYTVVIPPIGATRRFTVDSVSGPAYQGSITNGRIMWYHSLAAQGPQKDAPGQLAEITFRSDYYAPENNAGFQYLIGTDPDTLNANDFNLINYDVSYVDSMVLPVAMQADDVPVEQPVGGGTPKFPFGWAGSSQTIEDTETVIQGMQTAIKNFASSDPSLNGLGTYFADQAHPAGQGYPNYFNPNAAVDTKIPSGQNLFLSSPFNDVRSVYDNDRYALTSGGAGVVTIPGGAQGASDGTDILMLTPDPKLEGLGVGMLVTLGPNQPGGPVVPPDTRITSSPQYPDGIVRNNGQIVGVHLSNAIPKATTTQPTFVYNIATPLADYAATAIMSLWYTWANYYVAYAMNERHATEQMLSGIIDSTTAATNVLTLTDAVPASLVEGTAVSGAGIPDGNCIILKINGNQLILSELVDGSGTPISYKFTPPALTALAGNGDSQGPAPLWKLLQPFTPSGQTAIDFSKAVYEVMKTMSTTVPGGGKYPSIQLFANIIGATVSKLKSLPNVNSSPAGVDIQTRVTNAIKSVLRGVPDYTNALYSNQSLWYPDPSLAVEGSGQSFNIYNLDPFVWFVHEKMGLSGYGFSVDDDTADVGANYTNHLNVSVGGLGGLSTPAGWATAPPWTTAAPYGPVFGTPTVTPVNGSTRIAGLSPTLVKQVMAYNKPQNLLGSLVNGPGVPLGTTIANLDPAGGSVVLTDALQMPTAPFDFTFFAPVTVRGAVGTANQASTTIINLDGPAYETLQHLGPLSNIQVSGPGIGAGSPVTVTGLSVVKGVRTVTLSRPLLFPKRFKPGNYGYTFGYGRPYTPPGA